MRKIRHLPRYFTPARRIRRYAITVACAPFLAALLTGGLLTLCVAGNDASANGLPDLGDPSTGVFSPVDEQRLGRQFMRQIQSRLSLVEDPELQLYIDELRVRLAQAAGVEPKDYRFFIVDNPTLNAFAAPGGYIGLHTGLLLTAETESELAAVLAHEIAHVSQHHIARMVSRAKDLSLPAMAAMIAGILVGGQAGAAALVATNAAITADNLSYTRDFEREADAIGMRTLSAAGFDTKGMTQFFKRMERWARVQEIDVPEFLRTHPLTINRIAEAESRLSNYPDQNVGISERYQFARARVRALYSSRVDQSVSEFAANLAEQRYVNEISERYGYALALSRASQHADARQEIASLQSRFPGERRFTLARAEIELAAGDTGAALGILERARAQAPDDQLVLEKTAAALLQANRPREAAELLEPMTREVGAAPGRIQRLFAQASAESGNQLASHQAMAEYHYSRDELTAAISQLYAARPYTEGSYYEAARVEARIRDFNAEKVRFGE